MKKKLTGKQIKFIIINIISVGVFFFSYFYLYEGYIKKTENVYLQTEMIKGQIKDLEKKLSEEDEIALLIPEIREQKQAIIDRFPAYIKEEDNYMFIEQLEKSLNVRTSKIETSKNIRFYSTILPALAPDDLTATSPVDQEVKGSELIINQTSDVKIEAGNEGNTNAVTSGSEKDQAFMTAEYNTLSMSFLTNFKGFMDLVMYIKNHPENTAIDRVTVSFDHTTGALSGTLKLKRYLLTGTGKEYKAHSINGIPIGKDNLYK